MQLPEARLLLFLFRVLFSPVSITLNSRLLMAKLKKGEVKCRAVFVDGAYRFLSSNRAKPMMMAMIKPSLRKMPRVLIPRRKPLDAAVGY